jgi:crotonobetaine/carnitine-CoA ligase
MTGRADRPSLPAAVPTIDGLLAERAQSHPDRVFLRFADADLTFSDVDEQVTGVAAGLADLGVEHGRLVPVLLPNGPDFVITWLGLCRLGAVATLVNTALRGPALAHALGLARSDLVVVDHELLPSLVPLVRETATRRLVVSGTPTGDGLDGVELIQHAALARAGRTAPTPEHAFTDPAMVLFTSGTTGPSKGCVLSHRYAVRHAQLMIEHFGLRGDDVLYSPFPLFHLDASVLTVMPALVLGTTAAIGARFSVSGFWGEVRRMHATVFDFMGATLTMLHKRQPATDDTDHPVRLAWGVPVPEFGPEFEERFGLRLVEAYGSTDAGVPIYQPLEEPRRPGSCGRPIPQYDVGVVDDEDVEVPAGHVGELVVRPNEPSLLSDGYYGQPEATLASRRNLWFHTGDLVRRDDEGYIYFVGRRTDSIRRRGENISAFEVEEVVKLHPQVLDAAAYGVPSDLSEEDVMLAIVVRPGERLAPEDLIAFCEERMARHMLPRYVDVVDALPRTPTEKVEKVALRGRGVTATSWDRESAARPA